MSSGGLSTTEAAAVLGCTAQTVRRLIRDDELKATREPRKSRFVFRVGRVSVEAHLARHGRYDTPGVPLDARVAVLEAPLDAGAATTVAALQARVADLEAAFALGRLAAEMDRAADEARSEATQAVLEAVQSAERADGLRREARKHLDEALGIFTRPRDSSGLAP